MWSQWGVVTSPRWSLRGHIVVNHMCQTKSPSPVRQYVCILFKYYRVCICSMVFELVASWDRHFTATSETCLLDNPTHDECWQSRARFPVFGLPNQVSPFSQPPISTSPPPNHHGHPSPPVLYFPHSPSPNWANLEGQLKIQCHQVGTHSEFIGATLSMATSVRGWLF